MFTREKESISRSFSIAVIIVVTLIIAIFASILIFNTSERLEAELENRISQAFRLAQSSLAIPLWEYRCN